MTMTMTLRTTLAALAGVALLLTFGTSLQAQAPAAVTPVTDAVLQEPDPGDWLNWRRTLDGWGYSPLDEVDRTNVGSSGSPGLGVWSQGGRRPPRSCTTA